MCEPYTSQIQAYIINATSKFSVKQTVNLLTAEITTVLQVVSGLAAAPFHIHYNYAHTILAHTMDLFDTKPVSHPTDQ